MRIYDQYLGECEVEVTVAEYVYDSFIDSGYAIDQQRELSDTELSRFNHDYADKIHDFSLDNGSLDADSPFG